MDLNNILCYNCAGAYTLENKFFVFLTCGEVFCYNCYKNNVPSDLNSCPKCRKANIKVVDLNKKVSGEFSNIFSDSKKIFNSIHMELTENAKFREVQLEVITKAVKLKKEKFLKMNKMAGDADKELKKLKSQAKFINNKEKEMKQELENLYGKYKELKDKIYM
ncbi:Zinc finger, RING-type domain and Zinc finger, RING/FYVE/PHD-type domain-containing protein [Strongyloides ratti]|uniref:Zinc finger, RING-type domain and Zinc finger, RING/FYVE/PHD-type domain-containing protein n=1 Tax=Strongyloides ratti TaxID=34506 RepID=A0A090MUD6_STRRB|nr:Zinc finger, RING-type domain and Zinc finger, RING/FYVE/PHD-type domain-containing protein [Strongyloides ratti]CEF62163.1 Zinc finger, RING-type domain and Zinc finger, RING/FYVE/PHD-type domain-containing protein [Strongyloides ratti]